MMKIKGVSLSVHLYMETCKEVRLRILTMFGDSFLFYSGGKARRWRLWEKRHIKLRMESSTCVYNVKVSSVKCTTAPG